MAEHHAAVGRVGEQLHRALVVGFQHRAVHFVEFDHVIVALDAHDAAGTVVHQVVGDAVADAFQLDGRRVGAVDAAEVVDPAVLDEMPRRGERGSVAADDLAGAAADRVDVAAEQPVLLAALDGDAVAGQAADGAAEDQAALAVGQDQAVEASQVEVSPSRRTSVTSVHRQHRAGKHADLDHRGLQVGRRVQVQNARLAVQIPLARLVDLFQQVEGVVPDALPGVHARRPYW
jgi:hypothetical protein